MGVVIVKDGRSDWQVVNVTNGCKVCAFAAEELRKYIERTSGCELPVAGKVGDGPAIVLGLRKDLPSDEALLPKQAKGYDGYALRIAEKRIIICGDNERGVIYGVYDLLERIGCRWFYPQQDPKDTEVVPRLKTIELEADAVSVASPLRIRICNSSAFFFYVHPDIMKKQLDVAMKARYNGIGWQCDHRTYVGDQYKEMGKIGVIAEMKKRGMLLHGPGHSFPHFLSNDYFDQHPEWFGVRDGKRMKQVFGGAQFCWSNPEARKKFIDNAEKFLLDCPGIDIFYTVGFDGGQACECPECKKSTPGDLIFNLMNELTERLSESAPHVLVETSGFYNPVIDPPKNTKAHDKLRVIWAHWGRYHGYGFDDPRYEPISNLESWLRAVPGRLSLCMYYTDNFATPWVSAPYTIVLEGDRRYILDKGIDDIYMLVYPEGYWWNHALNNYMSGRCFYDASLDPHDVLTDYAVRYFGSDAGPLLAAYYGQWAKEIDLCYHVRDGSTSADRVMLSDQRRLWINPAVEAVKGDPVLSHRVGKVEKLHHAAERLTELHRRRERVEQARAAGDFKKASELLEKARTYADKEVIAYLTELADLNQGLIDRNEVPGFMTLGIKGWLDEEQKAIDARSREVKPRGW